MTTLRTTISQLANEFAAGVLDAIRGASLQEILAESGAGGGASVRRGRPSASAEGAGRAAAPAKRRGRGGRLGRRSAGDIAGLVQQIVQLLDANPAGLRAEQIREHLGLEAKELPRPIAEALSSRKIAKQGQKRATTYFARGGGGGARAKAGAKKSGRAKTGKKAARGGKRASKKRSKANAASNGAAQAS